MALLFALLLFAQPLVSLRDLMDAQLLPDSIAYALAHTDQLLPIRHAHRGGPIQTLPHSTRKLPNLRFELDQKPYDLYDYLAANRVAGLLILKDGQIVREDYQLNLTPNTRWASFSLAKSVTSTLIGIALHEGHIHSLDDTVDQYLPTFKSGPYAKVTVRQLLQMSSGINWDETYTNPTSNRRKLLEIQLNLKPGATLAYLNSLPRAHPAGTIFKYSTGESFLTGALLEAATRRPLAQYLQEKLWSTLGMDHDATWWTESPNGMGYAGSGLAASLRDYARFGQFILGGGNNLLPKDWLAQATTRQTLGDKPVEYGYLWWTIPNTQAFEARGIFGQFIYINPAERLVIVVLSARSKPTSAPALALDHAFFAAVTQALH
jgi:CubicO group peptidase (beta-lactamase class C family)